MLLNAHINHLLDNLLCITNSRELIEQLDQILLQTDAQPAVLWLLDPSSQTFFAAASFGCDAPSEEWGFDNPPSHRRFWLRSQGSITGAITCETAADLSVLAAVLGPVVSLVQQQEHLFDEVRQLHQQRQHLITAANLLRYLDLDVLLVEILQTMTQAVHAQVSALVILDESHDEGWHTAVSWGLRDDHICALKKTDGGLWFQAVIERGERVVLSDADEVAAKCDLTDFDGALNALLMLPLSNSERSFGAVILANPELGSFTTETERLATTVSDMAVIALTNVELVASRVESERLGRELDIAREVQQGMLPTAPLMMDQIEIAAAYQSCDETGGDYYTYTRQGDQVLALIGDVTGHGLGAALFTTVAHALLQQQIRHQSDLVSMLKNLNECLHLTRSGRFMTMAVAQIDPRTGAASYYSAGHNPLLWLHQGEVNWLPSHGLPLGLIEHYMGDAESGFHLDPGDYLVMYTDGITEAMNEHEECFGEERLETIVQRAYAGQHPPAELTEWILAAVHDWLGDLPSNDDLTLNVTHMRR